MDHIAQPPLDPLPVTSCDYKRQLGGALRYDGDKLQFNLIPPGPLAEVARVFMAGAKKYSAHNWRKGMAYSRVLDSMMRHIHAFREGQDNDPETGLPHMAHVVCNAMFLLEYAKTHPECDDRYRPLPKKD